MKYTITELEEDIQTIKEDTKMATKIYTDLELKNIHHAAVHHWNEIIDLIQLAIKEKGEISICIESKFLFYNNKMVLWNASGCIYCKLCSSYCMQCPIYLIKTRKCKNLGWGNFSHACIHEDYNLMLIYAIIVRDLVLFCDPMKVKNNHWLFLDGRRK